MESNNHKEVNYPLMAIHHWSMIMRHPQEFFTGPFQSPIPGTPYARYMYPKYIFDMVQLHSKHQGSWSQSINNYFMVLSSTTQLDVSTTMQ